MGKTRLSENATNFTPKERIMYSKWQVLEKIVSALSKFLGPNNQEFMWSPG